MRRHSAVDVLVSLFAISCVGAMQLAADEDAGSQIARTATASADWPWWRGPDRNGHANANQDPPTTWDASTNVAWKTRIPGKGHGSPIVVGDRVYLVTSEDELQVRSLLCLDRSTGEVLWQRSVHEGDATVPRNKKGTQASGTPACDGERIFVNFLHQDAAWVSAVSLGGELLWQTRICGYVVHQGYGSSPLVWEHLVIVAADNKAGGAIAGLDRQTGEVVWRRNRPQTPNYPSPVVVTAAGRTQLVLTGCDLVTSLDPLTGKEFWEIDGATTECVTTTITNGELIYTSGGYPTNHIAAVRADGSGETVWKNGVRVYVPSMLIREGFLYGVTDAGVAMCWEAATGKEIWKGRLGGTFSSSPVLVGNRIYVTNEDAETFVFAAHSQGFNLIAQNQLGDICFATPAICGNQILMRVAEIDAGQRQEVVYCLQRIPVQ